MNKIIRKEARIYITVKDQDGMFGLGIPLQDIEEEQKLFYITELFRAVLRHIADDSYRLDITERDLGLQGFGLLKPRLKMENVNE